MILYNEYVSALYVSVSWFKKIKQYMTCFINCLSAHKNRIVPNFIKNISLFLIV